MVQSSPVKPFVYVVAAIAALGGLLFGYDIGGSGGTLIFQGFRRHFGWPDVQVGIKDSYDVSVQKALISAFFTLGALVGALPSGALSELFGLKKIIMSNCVIFTFGTSLQASAINIYMMCTGRFIGGIGVGALSALVPTYQSEIAPEKIRGVLVTMQQLSITIGIVLAGAVNLGLRWHDWGWRFSYGGNIIFAVIMFVAFIFMDESPRWLVRNNEYEKARKVFSKIRVKGDIDMELGRIKQKIESAEKVGSKSWRDVFSGKNKMRHRLFIGCGGQFLQQLSGINAIMFFAPSIISDFFGQDASLYGNLGIQVANFLATFICLALIERAGRVTLLLTGAFGMFVSTIVVCILSSPLLNYKGNSDVGNGIIAFCVIYVIFFAYSWGPIIWVVCSEIFPSDLRGKGMGLATATNWLMATLVGVITPIMIDSKLSLWGTFLFFSVWNLLSIFFAAVVLPETAGRSLEDMNLVFDNFKAGSNLKKFSFLRSPSKSSPQL
ncbi:hypothetical protein Zmor_012152 [Zophobas morio]|jgi:sugar porter (SP) family MFS transporter|uniref:Major facilitator superfamily (MFS) profile domain-containing protein n=1 Tax=Zophobas morio TaxID=2755281 RepID=A0AA38LZV3_9CUCU|nr:hypothetical protein Zmor_012152 [Zophobas morio]